MFNRIGVIIGMSNFLLPFTVFPILANLLAQNRSLHRVAEIMGAGPFRIFLRITLPLALPGVLAGVLMAMTLSMGMYITPALLGGRKDLMMANLVDIYTRQTLDWGRHRRSPSSCCSCPAFSQPCCCGSAGRDVRMSDPAADQAARRRAQAAGRARRLVRLPVSGGPEPGRDPDLVERLLGAAVSAARVVAVVLRAVLHRPRVVGRGAAEHHGCGHAHRAASVCRSRRPMRWRARSPASSWSRCC